MDSKGADLEVRTVLVELFGCEAVEQLLDQQRWCRLLIKMLRIWLESRSVWSASMASSSLIWLGLVTVDNSRRSLRHDIGQRLWCRLLTSTRRIAIESASSWWAIIASKSSICAGLV